MAQTIVTPLETNPLRVDVALLREQRDELLKYVWDMPDEHIMWGVVELLDYLIDAVELRSP